MRCVCYGDTNEPRREKTGIRGFRPCPTQTRLYSYRRWLVALNSGFRKKRDTVKLICILFLHIQKSGFLTTRLKYVCISVKTIKCGP